MRGRERQIETERGREGSQRQREGRETERGEKGKERVAELLVS